MLIMRAVFVCTQVAINNLTATLWIKSIQYTVQYKFQAPYCTDYKQNSLIIWYNRILSRSSLSSSRLSLCSLPKPIPKSPGHMFHMAQSSCSFCSASFCLVRPIEPPHLRGRKPARSAFFFLFVECNTATPRYRSEDRVNTTILHIIHVMNAPSLQWAFKLHMASPPQTALPRHCPISLPFNYSMSKIIPTRTT